MKSRKRPIYKFILVNFLNDKNNTGEYPFICYYPCKVGDILESPLYRHKAKVIFEDNLAIGATYAGPVGLFDPIIVNNKIVNSHRNDIEDYYNVVKLKHRKYNVDSQDNLDESLKNVEITINGENYKLSRSNDN